MVEVISALGFVASGVLGYLLVKERDKVSRLTAQRDYYYQLALQYYNSTLQKSREVEAEKQEKAELSKRLAKMQKHLEDLKKERLYLEKAVRELSTNTKQFQRKIDKLIGMIETMTRIEKLQEELKRQLDALAKMKTDSSSKEIKKLNSELKKEIRKLETLKKDMEKIVEKLSKSPGGKVSVNLDKSALDGVIAELKSEIEEVRRVREDATSEFLRLLESFQMATTKAVNTVRSDNETYRNSSSMRGETIERFTLPLLLVKTLKSGKEKVIGKVFSDEIYHVGGYAPFDFIIVIPKWEKRGNRNVKKVKHIIFAEMKTGYAGLSDYEYDFARKVIKTGGDLFKYGVVRIRKISDKYRSNGFKDYWNRELWEVVVEIIEDEKRLKELKGEF